MPGPTRMRYFRAAGFDCAPRDHDRARNGSRRCGNRSRLAGPARRAVLPARHRIRRRLVRARPRGKLRLPGTGEDYVTLVHIADMADATVAALSRWPSRQSLIVADDAPSRWRDVFDYIATAVGGPPPMPGGPPVSHRFGSGIAERAKRWHGRRAIRATVSGSRAQAQPMEAEPVAHRRFGLLPNPRHARMSAGMKRDADPICSRSNYMSRCSHPPREPDPCAVRTGATCRLMSWGSAPRRRAARASAGAGREAPVRPPLAAGAVALLHRCRRRRAGRRRARHAVPDPRGRASTGPCWSWRPRPHASWTKRPLLMIAGVDRQDRAGRRRGAHGARARLSRRAAGP